VWGKREVVAPHVRPEHIVTAAEGGSALLPVPGYARALGLGDVRVKQCGISHTGSFKDLGMTVLVSTVKQIIADGARGARDRVRVDRRHLGGAGGLRRRGRRSPRW
jgi:threonine synthase